MSEGVQEFAFRTNDVWIVRGIAAIAALGFVLETVKKSSNPTPRLIYGAAVLVGCLLVIELLFLPQRRRRVLVDHDARTVTIRWFTYPNSFFDVLPKRRVTIPFDEIRSYRLRHSRVQSTCVVKTDRSRFVFSSKGPGYDALKREIHGIAQDGELNAS